VASTGTKDPKASDVLYVKALVAPDTINTMPKRLFSRSPITASWTGFCQSMAATPRRHLPNSPKPGSTIKSSLPIFSARAPDSFVASWQDLLDQIGTKAAALKAA